MARFWPESARTWQKGLTGLAEKPLRCLVDDLEPVFLDHWVGQNFFRNAFQLLLRFITIPAVEIQHKKFTLADILDFAIAEPRQRVVNCLSLGVENGAFWHDPNVCFHGCKL
jgi:hypothetical protein